MCCLEAVPETSMREATSDTPALIRRQLCSQLEEGWRELDLYFRGSLKDILHLPPSFPTHLIHLPCRDGGLGILSLEGVGAEVQFKAFERLTGLNNQFTDALLNKAFREHTDTLREYLGIFNTGGTAEEVSARVRKSRVARAQSQREAYENQGLFSHIGDKLGNRWLAPHCAFLRDGDKIKALRLRSNLYPTRTLFNKHATSADMRLCRRCGREPETAFHILQVCDAVHDQRTERHNWISRQVARLIERANPSAKIGTEVTFTVNGQKLRPDVVVETQHDVTIADIAVTWDATPGILDGKNREKSLKYACLATLFAPRPVSVMGLSFGARSMISNSTKRNGRALGLKEADLAWLASRTLIGSLIILQRFGKLVR